MKISVFGLGYVGCVTAACFANKGHHVIGVDPNIMKVDLINAGVAPLTEPGLNILIKKAVAKKLLFAIHHAEEAIFQSDLSLICVGTPSDENGLPDLSNLKKVCMEIGKALAQKKRFHTIAVRSTILPGTTRSCVIPAIERYSKRKMGKHFSVCHHPEFLREGSAVKDFHSPSRIVIGEAYDGAGDMLASLYRTIRAPIIRCSLEVSEMVKYADNAWHATKVAFGNEIGTLCKMHNIDSHDVMDVFCKDKKLNLSSHYLKPGFAFGGSCLPKDVRALNSNSKKSGAMVPLLGALLPSNVAHIERGLQTILDTKKKSIGFLGICFKAGTDDLRESPLVTIIQSLLAQGLDLLLYDRNICPKKLTGANQDFIYDALPYFDQYLAHNIDHVLRHSDVIVIGNHDPEYATLADRLRKNQIVVDFVRIHEIEKNHKNYRGICW